MSADKPAPVGQRFGRLVVLEEGARGEPTLPKGQQFRRWRCICDCGNYVETWASNIKSGRAKSCGCLSREVSRQMHADQQSPSR